MVFKEIDGAVAIVSCLSLITFYHSAQITQDKADSIYVNLGIQMQFGSLVSVFDPEVNLSICQPQLIS